MRIYDYKGGKIQYAVMDSIYEMFEAVSEPTGKNCRDRQNARLAQLCARIHGDEVKHLIRGFLEPQGEFDDQVEQAKRDLAGLLDRINVQRSRPVRKIKRRLDSGETLDATAHVQRRTDGWSEVRKERRPHKAIRIAVNVSMSFDARERGFSVNRGAAFAAVSDILESIGYTTEIALFDVTRKAGRPCESYVVQVPVKGFGVPLNVSQIAFMASNVGFISKVVYPMQARVLSGWSNHWGLAGPVPEEISKEFDIVVDQVFSLHDAAFAIKKFADELS